MGNTIGAKPTIDNTEFINGIKLMNSELRVLESGFKASAAAMGDWSSSATGLEARSKTLTSSIEIQRSKVEATRAEWERIKQTQGENSVAANIAETKLNKETESLNRMEGELNTTDAALGEMKSGTDKTGDSVETMGNKSTESGKKLFTLKDAMGAIAGAAKIAVAAIAAVAAAAVAAAGALVGFILKSSEAADGIAQLAGQTGMTTDKIQELAYIGSQLDVSAETMTGAFTKMTKSMGAAQDEAQTYDAAVLKAIKSGKGIEDIKLGGTAEAYKQLGISVTDASGNLRDNNVVFDEVVKKLGEVKNPTERDVLAMQLLGKSAMELNPLLAATPEELAKLAEEAHKTGAVALPESIASLDKLSDGIAGLKLNAQGVGMNFAAMFAPFGSGIVTQAQGYLEQLNAIVIGAKGNIGDATSGIGALFGKIATDIAGQIPSMLKVGLTIVKSFLKSILAALPTLLTAASEILNSLVGFISVALPVIIPAAISILLMLINTIISNLPLLISAALQAVIALANGLSAALPTLIPVIVQAVLTIVQTLIDNLPMLVAAALNLIVALAEGISAALPLLSAQAPAIMQALIVVLIASIPLILKAAGVIIMALARGLADYWNNLIPVSWKQMSEKFLTGMAFAAIDWIKSIVDIISNVVSTIENGFAGMYDLGSNIVAGIKQGIIDAWVDLINTFEGLIDLLPEAVKKILGISSPSTVMEWMGEQMMAGLANGITGKSLLPQLALNATMGKFADEMSLALNMGNATAQGSGMRDQNNNENYAFYGPTYVSGGAARSLGNQIKGRAY